MKWKDSRFRRVMDEPTLIYASFGLVVSRSMRFS